jgi:hypothetical protein
MIVTEICTCTELDSQYRPVGVKGKFTPLDEYIVVWFKVEQVIRPCELTVSWHKPDGSRAFTVTIPVEPTTAQRPWRYCWSVMNTGLLHFIDGPKYGSWIVQLEPVDCNYEFSIAELPENYGNPGDIRPSPSLLNKTV